MKIKFADKSLERLWTDEAHKTRLPAAVIKAARRKLAVFDAAPDERTLRNWKSLRYEKLSGDKDGLRSVRLNDQWRMILEFDEEEVQPTLVILSIEDYH